MYPTATLSNYRRTRQAKNATLRYAYRTLTYAFILAMMGGFIGASTNNRWAMILGTLPGLIGIVMLMYLHHDEPCLDSPRVRKSVNLAHHCIGGASAFWTFAVSMYVLMTF